MNKRALCIIMLFIGMTTVQAQWSQTGNSITGDATGDYFGSSVSISGNGSVVAIGALYNDGNGIDSGQVKIFENSAGVWSQIGSDLYGDYEYDYFGHSISLSQNGNVVAIAAPGNDTNGHDSGHVKVYQRLANAWSQIGNDILGEDLYDWSGKSLHISGDGSMVAIGAYKNNGNGDMSGQVRVYKNISDTWTQIGNDIDGEAAGDRFGRSVCLSFDGSILAAGATQNDDNGVNAGHVRVFENISNSWVQFGNDIDGEAADDRFGFSVDMSNDASVLIAGAYNNDGNGDNSGHARVFQYNSGNWTQIGNDIDGEGVGDLCGYSVSMNNEGSIIAVGSPKYDETIEDEGQVRIFSNNSGNWMQIDGDIYGNDTDDFFGYATSLNENASVIAVGAVGNINTKPGFISVFQNDNLELSEWDNERFSIYPNPTDAIVNIKFPVNLNENYTITIQSILGQTISTIEGIGADEFETHSIDTSKMAEGQYIIGVNTKNGKSSYKSFNVTK